MADAAHEERLRQHEAILRSLTAMLVAQQAMNERQEAMNQRIEGFIQEQRVFNARQVEIKAHLEITQARIGTLLAVRRESGR